MGLSQIPVTFQGELIGEIIAERGLRILTMEGTEPTSHVFENTFHELKI